MILGNLLFTITTDGIDNNISYEQTNLNNTRERSNNSMSENERSVTVFPIDLSLARIVDENEAALGMNNITVLSDIDNDGLLPFN